MAQWRKSGHGAFHRRSVAGPERFPGDFASGGDQRAAGAGGNAVGPPRDRARIDDSCPGQFDPRRSRRAAGRCLCGEPQPWARRRCAGIRANYAALLDRDNAAQENNCLAEAIYFEARGESDAGQAAVAQVVLNRVASGLYPATICGVVYQNRHRWHGCQFIFACEGRSLRVTEPEAWQKAERIAAEVRNGKTYVSDIAGSTHYHANYVRPRWARRLEKMDVIGHHIFYKLRPGQS